METKVITMASREFGTVRKIKENGITLYCGADVAKALGYAVPRKAIIDHCKGVLKRNTLTNGGKQALNFIPEGDVWRLICHSKLPNAEQFEKWIFDDVVPTVAKTGKYEVPAEQLTLETEEYHYFSKTYNGEPVLTMRDVEHFTGMSQSNARHYFLKYGNGDGRYRVLRGRELNAFKRENPSVSKRATFVGIVTREGFIDIMEYYGYGDKIPQNLLTDNKPAVKQTEAPAPHKPDTDELIIALNALRYARHESEKCSKIANMSSMDEYYAKQQEGLDTARKYIAMMLSV